MARKTETTNDAPLAFEVPADFADLNLTLLEVRDLVMARQRAETLRDVMRADEHYPVYESIRELLKLQAEIDALEKEEKDILRAERLGRLQ